MTGDTGVITYLLNRATEWLKDMRRVVSYGNEKYRTFCLLSISTDFHDIRSLTEVISGHIFKVNSINWSAHPSSDQSSSTLWSSVKMLHHTISYKRFDHSYKIHKENEKKWKYGKIYLNSSRQITFPENHCKSLNELKIRGKTEMVFYTSIVKSCWWRKFPWLFFVIHPKGVLILAGHLYDIQCLYRKGSYKSFLVGKHRRVHMRELIGGPHLWVPSCFTSRAQYVWFVFW